MGDLVYAALVITIIWAGIFVYLVGQNRRLKRLEEFVSGMSDREPVSPDGGSVEPGGSEEESEA